MPFRKLIPSFTLTGKYVIFKIIFEVNRAIEEALCLKKNLPYLPPAIYTTLG